MMNIGSLSQSSFRKVHGKRKYMNVSVARLTEDISKLVASVEIRSNLESKLLNPPRCNIVTFSSRCSMG